MLSLLPAPPQEHRATRPCRLQTAAAPQGAAVGPWATGREGQAASAAKRRLQGVQRDTLVRSIEGVQRAGRLLVSLRKILRIITPRKRRRRITRQLTFTHMRVVYYFIYAYRCPPGKHQVARAKAIVRKPLASRPTRNMPTDRFHPEAAAPPRPQSRKPRNGTRPAQARAANSRRPTSTNPTSAWVVVGTKAGVGDLE